MLRTTLVALFLPAAAMADGYYAEIFGGISDLRSTDLDFSGLVEDGDFDTGPILGGAIGYDYADSPWRSELEFTYRSADTNGFDGDFASTALAINGYYDFAGSGRITPYLGAGLVYVTEIDLDVESGPQLGEYSDRGVVAGQIMLGARMALSDRVDLSGELRYLDAGSVTLDRDGGGDMTADYSTVELMLGLGWRF
ncbi:MAG: outer membrane beta-barrel protein [Pseudomonadota bacterium]